MKDEPRNPSVGAPAEEQPDAREVAELRDRLDALKTSATPVVDQADLERWLFDHAEDFLNEVARLREQLDALIEAVDTFVHDDNDFELIGALNDVRAALAAVEAQEKSSVSAPTEGVGRAPDGEAEA